MNRTALCNRLVIGNSVTELRRMSQWLRECATAAGIPRELVLPLDHCAIEAVHNIISYAYDDARPHAISLQLGKTGNGARLVIRDDGKPFNMMEAPARARHSNLEDAAIGGLGIPLIRRLMAHCAYRREDGLNVLVFEAEREPRPGNA
jgi:anti-sigma regulatory factor (Ser/Thr protein kinase)